MDVINARINLKLLLSLLRDIFIERLLPHQQNRIMYSADYFENSKSIFHLLNESESRMDWCQGPQVRVESLA